jgi:hypothetical protein
MQYFDLYIDKAKKVLELAYAFKKSIPKYKNINYSKPALEGKKYELQIHNILKHTIYQNKPFHKQKETELGGCSSNNDIICQYNDAKIGIEVKKCGTPDWMQCTIKFNPIQKKWYLDKGKIPDLCKNIFNTLLSDIVLFHDHKPPFIEKQMTHEEWVAVKSKSSVFNDMYIDIPNDTIAKLYKAKGCHYIQISDYGLYHLGYDVCGFGVPEFIVEEQIRIRIKVHSRKNTKGFCDLSVTAACQPKHIQTLSKSSYSLDNVNRLPVGLTYSI